MSTGRKDRRITIETWTPGQAAGGGPQSSITSSYTMWANIENRDGRLITAENQRQWPYNYKIITRFETSRPITNRQTILYGSVRMAINSVTIDREGMKEENILRCSTIGTI